MIQMNPLKYLKFAQAKLIKGIIIIPQKR